MFGTLPSSWSAITRPKTMMVSGRTIRIRPRPNSSGFSAIAPTVAPPTTFSAHAVAIPVPAIVIAAEIAAKGSAMCLYLRCRSRTKGSERSSVSLEELDKRLDVIQSQGLDPRGDPSEQEHEELGEDEEDDAQDQETDLAGADQAFQDDRVERGGDGGLPDAEARETRVGHDVREEARDLDRCDNGFGQPKQTTEDQDERNKGDRLSHETAQVPFEGPGKPGEGNVPDPVSDRAPREDGGQEREEAEETKEPAQLGERVFLVVAELVDESEYVSRSQMEGREQEGKVHHVLDVQPLVNERVEGNVDAERLEAQLFGMAEGRMEGHAKCFAEHEETEEEGPDPSDSRHEEDPPPDRFPLDAGGRDESHGNENGSVARIADHESEEERRRDEQEQRGVEFAVARRGVQVDEELERFGRFRIPQLDWRLRLLVRVVGFRGLDVRSPGLQLPPQLLEAFLGDPPVDDEAVVAHREPKRRLRFVDLDLQSLLRGDHEVRIFLPKGVETALDLFESTLPFLPVGHGGVQEDPRISFPGRDVDLREPELPKDREHAVHGGLRDEDREDSGALEQLGGDALEVFV